MLWIGLTGGIACGKSSVSGLLRRKGYAVVDADELAREVTQKGTAAHAEIVSAFGPVSVAPDGSLNRAKIAEMVFADRNRLEELERIIHPRVRELSDRWRKELAERGDFMAFYDVPLLFEKKMAPLFDRVVAVVCRPDLQKERLMARNNLSAEEAGRRIAAQLPLAEKARLAQHLIENNGSLTDLEAAVDRLLGELHHAHT